MSSGNNGKTSTTTSTDKEGITSDSALVTILSSSTTTSSTTTSPTTTSTTSILPTSVISPVLLPTSTSPTSTSSTSTSATSTTAAASPQPEVIPSSQMSQSATSETTLTVTIPASSSYDSSAQQTSSSYNGTSPVSKASSGYSVGALAGSIVGSILGAALLAALVTALICTRKRKRERRYADRRGPSTTKSGDSAFEKEPVVATTSNKLAWQSHLPQGSDDETIRSAVKTVVGKIELHVDNYYGKAVPQIDELTSQRLARVDSDRLPRPLYKLLSDSRSILPAIKHCVASILIDAISPGAESSTASLLPPHLSVLPKALQDRSVHSRESNAARQAYSQWRSLNALLYPKADQDAGFRLQREDAAEHMADFFSETFSLWQARQGDGNAIKQNFRGIAASVSALGTLIMSQPSSYDFRWNMRPERQSSTSSRSSVQSLETFPALWKLSDEHGNLLDQPQILVPPASTQLRKPMTD